MVKATADPLVLPVRSFANRRGLDTIGPVTNVAAVSSHAGRRIFWHGARGCSWFPDEEGTESGQAQRPSLEDLECCSWFPDEEGTERRFSYCFLALPCPGCSWFPDEEDWEGDAQRASRALLTGQGVDKYRRVEVDHPTGGGGRRGAEPLGSRQMAIGPSVSGRRARDGGPRKRCSSQSASAIAFGLEETRCKARPVSQHRSRSGPGPRPGRLRVLVDRRRCAALDTEPTRLHGHSECPAV